MLVIFGALKFEPGLVEGFMAEARPLVVSTRAEAGCLFYGFAVEDASAGTVMLAERWRDQAALDEHLARPEIAAFLASWGPRMDAKLRKFDASNERDLMD